MDSIFCKRNNTVIHVIERQALLHCTYTADYFSKQAHPNPPPSSVYYCCFGALTYSVAVEQANNQEDIPQ
jgi:hypothetical protein